jgi:hypothetical protein
MGFLFAFKGIIPKCPMENKRDQEENQRHPGKSSPFPNAHYMFGFHTAFIVCITKLCHRWHHIFIYPGK